LAVRQKKEEEEKDEPIGRGFGFLERE